MRFPTPGGKSTGTVRGRLLQMVSYSLMPHAPHSSHHSAHGTAMGADEGTWMILCSTMTPKAAVREIENTIGMVSSSQARSGTITHGNLDGIGKKAIDLTSSHSMKVLNGRRQRIKIFI